MKERVTLTIDQDLLEQVDDTIDGSLVKNRSHAFELLLKKALGNNRLKKAFILAGGETEEKDGEQIPASMLKVAGKPILHHNIELLKKHGVEDVIISLGPNGKDIKRYFEDGSEFELNISYVEEENPLGTAGPLKLAEDELDEAFVMMNADELKDIDLKDMFEFHKEQDGFATIALTTVNNPSDYGVAVMNGNKITTFVEKPDPSNTPSNLINAGLYIMEPEVLDLVPEGFAKLEDDLFPKLAQDEKLFGYPFSGQWFDPSAKGKYKINVKGWKGIRKERKL